MPLLELVIAVGIAIALSCFKAFALLNNQTQFRTKRATIKRT